MVKGNAIGAGGLGFASRTRQLEQSRQRFGTAATCLGNYVAEALSREDGPCIWRNIAR